MPNIVSKPRPVKGKNSILAACGSGAQCGKCLDDTVSFQRLSWRMKEGEMSQQRLLEADASSSRRNGLVLLVPLFIINLKWSRRSWTETSSASNLYTATTGIIQLCKSISRRRIILRPGVLSLLVGTNNMQRIQQCMLHCTFSFTRYISVSFVHRSCNATCSWASSRQKAKDINNNLISTDLVVIMTRTNPSWT